jgi:serine/threonine-protein kinase HipA
LPLRTAAWKGAEAAAWFGNLLPEGSAREAVCGRLGISVGNEVDLLAAIGGECAGALRVVPSGLPRCSDGEDTFEELAPRQLAGLLVRGSAALLVGGPMIRLSLAGAQDKLPVCLVDGKVALPTGSTASTHLLKLPHARFAHLPMNEAYVMGLAARIGLDVATVEAYSGTSPPSLLVERYDRRVEDGQRVARLHQEDFCQATGRPTARKYQQEGGPSLAECAELLARHASRPLVELRRLVEWQAFNVAVGNSDGHGKNLSLLYDGAGVRLAPFYDLLSTRHYQALDRALAMGVGQGRDADTLSRQHWEAFAEDASLGRKLVVKTVQDVLDRVKQAQPSWAAEFADRHGRHPILQTLPRWIEKNLRATARRLA